MAKSLLPLLVGAGIAIAVTSKKKKKKSKPTPELAPAEGDKCDVSESAPAGFICEGGVLEQVSVSEADLELDDEPEGEAAGDFDIRDEELDVGDDEDEEIEEPEEGDEGDEVDEGDGTEPEDDEPPTMAVDPYEKCDEFLRAVHIKSASPDEYPINEVAVSETVIPIMDKTVKAFGEMMKPVDPEIAGPKMVLESLEALVPVCSWKYDELEDEFTFDDGREIRSDEGKEVLFGLMALSVKIIDEFNQGNTLTLDLDPAPNVKTFTPQEGNTQAFTPQEGS